MAWVKFKRDFDWKPTSQTTIAYKAGSTLIVREECAAEAVRKGAAVRMEKKAKDEPPVEVKDAE